MQATPYKTHATLTANTVYIILKSNYLIKYNTTALYNNATICYAVN